MVNGRSIFDDEEGERLLSTRMLIPPRRHRAKPLAMVLVFVMILVLVGAMVVMVPTSKEGIVIDGEFEDWKGVPKFTDRTGDFPNTNIDIVSYAISRDGDDMAVLVEVAGQVLDGNVPIDGRDTLIVYFDNDGDDLTGYRMYGFGVDYVIEVSGWDNTIQSASVKEFRTDHDPHDWNGFTAIGSVSAACRGGQIEIKATDAAGWLDDPDSRFGVNIQTNLLEGDWTPFTYDEPGAVVVLQTSLGVVGEYLMPGEQYDVLRIDVAAYDVEAHLGYMTVVSALDPPPTLLDLGKCELFLDFNRNGVWDSADVSLAEDNWGTGDDGGASFNMEETPLIIDKGNVQRLFLVVKVGGAPPMGRAVMLGIADPYAVEAEDLPVTVFPVEGRASYISGFSTSVIIDGLFEDWHNLFEENGGNVTRHTDPLGDAPRASLDLYHYAQFIDPEPGSDRALFYAEVDPASRALLGTLTPLRELARPTGTGGGGGPGPSEPPVVIGEDTAQFFLDVEDAEPSTHLYGQRVTHVIDVRGQGGLVNTAVLWKYSGDDTDPWLLADDEVEAAAGPNEIEVSLDLSDLGRPEAAFVLIVGWDGGIDAGSSMPLQDIGGETRTGGIGDDPPLPIPEFRDLAMPVLCTLVMYAVARRRKRP